MKNLYSIYDKKACVFSSSIYVVDSEVILTRDLKTLVNSNQNNQLVNYPADFDLIYLGTFDERTGVMNPDKKIILTLSDLKNDKGV